MTEEKKMLFSQDALKKLLWPLIIEQFLAIAMGMADTVMAASCGEAVVSGISLVDSICVLLIGLFTAMASGGAVVAAQYMGHGDKEMVGRASNQLFIAVGGVALLFMTIALIWNRGLLALLYGNVEADVMSAARIYFYIVAVSFPFLGIYNGGAALFRAVGDSKVSMKVSLAANLVNVVGNAILIYGVGIGAAGAALSTLFSRVLSAVLIVMLLKKSDKIIMSNHWRLDTKILGKILYIGVPNGLENSIFQIGKLLTTSLIAGFGMACRNRQHCQLPADPCQCHRCGNDHCDRTVHRRRRNRAGIILSEKNDESSICLYDPVGNSHDYFCSTDLRNLSSESGDNENNCFSVMLQLCMLYAGASVVLCTVQCTSCCGRCEVHHDRGDRFHVALPCGHGIYFWTGSGTRRHRRMDRYDHGLGRTGIFVY